MLSKNAGDAFDHFCEIAYSGEILGSKPTNMLKLAVAMAVGCYP